MPDERSSPSGGWQAVYSAMEVSTGIEGEPPRRCPDCDRPSAHLAGEYYRCPVHGIWARSEES